MKTNYRDNWPVCHRCEEREAERRGERRHDDVTCWHWCLFSILFGLIVIAPAIVEWIA